MFLALTLEQSASAWALIPLVAFLFLMFVGINRQGPDKPAARNRAEQYMDEVNSSNSGSAGFLLFGILAVIFSYVIFYAVLGAGGVDVRAYMETVPRWTNPLP